MHKNIEEFINQKNIAVVGVSDKKFGGAIYKTLKQQGYNVYPVHPARSSFGGDTCYPKLSDLPSDATAAVIAVSPGSAESILDEDGLSAITHLWFQQGKDFSKAIARAEARGIKTISKKCILMYAQPVTGIHAVHRFLARLFGRI
jgi:predicted CoA-binding protein